MFNVNEFHLSSNPWTLFGIYLIFSSVLTALVLVFAVLRPWWKRKTENRELEAKKRGLRSVVKAELDGSIPLAVMESSVD